jgi:hypothetical protein
VSNHKELKGCQKGAQREITRYTDSRAFVKYFGRLCGEISLLIQPLMLIAEL